MSPSREVLDLSLPKHPADDGEDLKDVKLENGASAVVVSAVPTGLADSSGVEDSLGNSVDDTATVKSEVYPSSNNSSSEEDMDYGGNKAETLGEHLLPEADHDEIVFFEPSSMPSMPEANLSCQESQTKPASGHSEEDHELNGLSEEDWKADDYSGLMDEEEDEEDRESLRSRSPLQFDDPNRIDCKFCGMIFDAPHVRKFHESSHDEEFEEYDGELTRLFCGFCGKTFKKVQYRILHEKGHTGELAICCSYCDRRFRWESELRAHNRLFCTADRPARPLGLKKFKPSTPSSSSSEAKKTTPSKESRPQQSNGYQRHADRDDWRSHPTLPTGWKLRSRPRPTQEGQMYFVFLSPEGQVLHSRRAVLQHMEKSGCYSREELKRMRLHCKTGPRGRRPKSLVEEDNSNSMDLDTSGSNLDFTDSSNNMMDLSLDNYVKDDDDVLDDDDRTEGKRKKSTRFSDRKLLHKRRVNKA
jgi:hypothetical protein